MAQISAADFLQALYGTIEPGETIELRLKTPHKTHCVHFNSIQKAAGAAARAASEADVYFGVALRDGRGGRRENITRIPAAWADLDAREGLVAPLARLRRSPVPVSAAVYSGRGLHCYWFLSEHPGQDGADEIERLNRLIAAVVEGDSVHDAARVLRMPDTFNWKYGEPLDVNVMGMRPDRRYNIEHMCALFSAHAPAGGAGPAPNPAPRAALAANASLPCRKAMWSGVAEGSRNAACFQLAVDLKRQGLPEQPAYAALLNWNKNNTPPMDARELERTVAGAYSGDYGGLGCDKEPMRSLCEPGCRAAAPAVSVKPAGEPEPERESPLPPGQACWTPSELAAAGQEPEEFIVERLVPARGVTMLTGEGGLGKSFVALEMACACACGGEFLGRFACRQGPALIVDVENDESLLGRRIAKIAAGRGLELDGLQVRVAKSSEARRMMRIDSLEGRHWLEGLIAHYKPALVVIDSMVAIHSQDENNNVVMRQVMMWLEGFAREHGLGLVLVHHHRKRGVYNDAGQMMRGASDLRNATVSHIAMRKSGGSRLLVEQDKCRCGQAVPAFVVEISDSPDGSAVYVRYVSEASGEAVSTKLEQARRMVLEMLGEKDVCEFRELAERGEAMGLGEHLVKRAAASLVAEGSADRRGRGLYVSARPG